MIYHWETRDEVGEFEAADDNEAIEKAKELDGLLVIYRDHVPADDDDLEDVDLVVDNTLEV